jgi:hypothetical protein
VTPINCQTACKPGSVRPGTAPWNDPEAGRPFLWDAHRCAPRAIYPGDGAEMPPLRRCRVSPNLPPAAPSRSCSRWGLPCRPRCRGRGALLPHRFTLARGGSCLLARAVCFLWHFPWGRPRRPLAGTVFPWSPDFPPPALALRQRPSGRLATPHMCRSGAQVNAVMMTAQAASAYGPVQRRATATRRAMVPMSGWPVTASGRQ